MHTHELDDADYGIEDEARYRPDPDPVSVALGAAGFLTRHVIDECREQFADSRVSRFPECFDRYYWEPSPVLIDVLEDASPEQVKEERERKRCAFKADWCAAHGLRYLALAASDAQDPQKVRELLHALGPGERPGIQEPAFTEGGVGPARAARGKIHRPKAS